MATARAEAIRRASRRLALGALGAAALAASCDWRTFDDLQDRVPVVAVSAPDRFAAGSADFGTFTLPVSPPSDDPGVAARYLVSGSTMTGLALVQHDGGGHASTQNITSTALDALAGAPIGSMAEIPAAAGPLVIMGSVRPEVIGGGQVLVLSLGSELLFTAFTPPDGTGVGFGLGVAAQNFVGAAAPDYIVLDNDTLRVYEDGIADATALSFVSSPTCPIGLPVGLPAKYRQNRAVAAADWGGGMQIAVGTPTVAGPGSVSVFSVASGGVSCAFNIVAPAGEARFGQAIAAGDFNGDKTMDLLVGAPPGKAYVFFGPLGGTSAGVPLVSSSGGVELGAAVAAVNVDGAGGDEAVVGDPGATVDDVMQAGRVVVFRVPSATATPTVKVELTDRYPGASGAYGASVGALQFCKGACAPADSRRLVLVGAAAKTYTAFQLVPGDPDPRAP